MESNKARFDPDRFNSFIKASLQPPGFFDRLELGMNRMIYLRQKENKIVILTHWYKAIITWDSTRSDVKIKIVINNLVRALLIIIVVFVGFGSLIFENVTINGNSDPDLWEKLTYSFFGLLCFSPILLLVRGYRTKFRSKLEEGIAQSRQITNIDY